MRLVRQPRGSSLCGQACVAMLCGMTLDEACDLVGRRGPTNTRHLKYALRTVLGPDATDECRVRGFPHVNETALLFWRRYEDSRGHWTVWYDGKHYDPIAGVFPRDKPPIYLRDAWRVTSYLRVRVCMLKLSFLTGETE